MKDDSDFEVEDGLPPWGQVPRRVMLDPKLTNNDRALYATLATYASRRTREAFPKQSVLGAALGSERTVRRSAKNLEKLGWLTMRRIRGGTGQYAITIYKLLGFKRSEDTIHRPVEAGGLFDDQRPDVAPDQRPVVVETTAYRSTDQTTTDQETPAVPALPTNGVLAKNGKLDTVAAREFLDRFVNWYGRQYKRPYAPLTKTDVFSVAGLLRRLGPVIAATPALHGKNPVDVVRAAVMNAMAKRWEFFPLNKGEPMTLRIVVGHWARLQDLLLAEAQERGVLEPPNDPDLHLEPL